MPPPQEPRKNTPARPEPVATAPVNTTNTGVLVAFDPVLKNDGTPEAFRVFLLNDTEADIIYSFDLYVGNQQRISRNGKLSAGNTLDTGHISFDDLNDSPEIEAECWRITTDGTGGKLEKLLRIKPKVFFGRLMEAPLIGRRAHVFPLFERLEASRPKPGKEEDLSDYTKRNARPNAILAVPVEQRDRHEVREAAEFLPELDLHAEKLVPDPSRLNNAQILQLQLKVFEEYIEKAHRLGFERVFIIHGLGTGRLKDAIASRLLRMPEVVTFKNEYHPKYGYGATEVLLF
ncbi:MAG: Smr/MutS family protein [Haliscomenobacter sp.]